MYFRKTKNSITRQRGFFTIGVGLAILAISGAFTTGIVTTHNSGLTDDKKLVSQPQIQLSSNADGHSISQHDKKEMLSF